MILLHATQRDLLLWQRVNKDFRDTIKDRRCQEKLFFQASIYEEDPGPPEDDLTWNPMTDISWGPCVVEKKFRKSIESTYHPRRKVELLDHPNASWKAMFVSSPAITTLSIFVQHRYRRDGSRMSHRIELKTGVTIGDLGKFLVGLGLIICRLEGGINHFCYQCSQGQMTSYPRGLIVLTWAQIAEEVV